MNANPGLGEVWDVGEWIRTTGELLARTAPFIVLRVLIQLVWVLAVLCGLALVFGLGRICLGLMGRPAAGAVFLFGAAAVLVVGWICRRYLLYLAGSAHVAVIAGILSGDDPPRGFGQAGWGWRRVRTRLGPVTALFAIDAVVRGGIRDVRGRVNGVAPGLGWSVLAVAAGHADEAVFGHIVRTPGFDWRQTAVEGVRLYAGLWRKLVPAAAGVVAAGAAVWFAVTAAALSPALGLAWMVGPESGPRVVAVSAAVGLAFLSGAAVRSIVIVPLGTVVMVGGFLRATAGTGSDGVGPTVEG